MWLCPSLPIETLKWLSSLPILMQKSFWWWQCSDRYVISLSPHLHTPFPTFSPSLIYRTVSVDVKHHVYLHWRAGKLILPDPSLSTEQKMSAIGILNLPQQLAYNKGIFMHKVLINNPPNYLAQCFINHQSHYTNSRNNLYVPRPRLDLFKTSIYPSLERPSGTPCLRI